MIGGVGGDLTLGRGVEFPERLEHRFAAARTVASTGGVLGVGMIAGRRLGYVPTKLLAVVGGAALVSVLAFVALLIAFLLFGGFCCS